MEEHVVLVDDKGRNLMDADGLIRSMPKLEAHRKPTLHRAISVFIFSSGEELLLQKRAENKYHSAGLWSNTCCSHPRPDETPLQAAERRLQEEMGLRCDLQELMSFTYQAGFSNGLYEYEYDHVFVGFCDSRPQPDAAEVEDWQWQQIPELSESIKMNPGNYSYWLKRCLTPVLVEFYRLQKYGTEGFVPAHLDLRSEPIAST